LVPTTIVGSVSVVIAFGANWILIFGLGSWSGFGFIGSPWATVVASWFQPIALIGYCVVYKQYHRSAWGGWKRAALTAGRMITFMMMMMMTNIFIPDICVFKLVAPQLQIDRMQQFLRIAGPIASNSFVSNLANSMISLVAARLGSENIAANAVISGLWGVLWALFWGYGCATQMKVATYLGAGTHFHFPSLHS
jgi:MATE family multidrug resistance protein